jgi:hypothetical protein
MDESTRQAFDSIDEFRTALCDLLLAGHDSGLRIARPWECRTGPDGPDWEVDIARLQPTGASEQAVAEDGLESEE